MHTPELRSKILDRLNKHKVGSDEFKKEADKIAKELGHPSRGGVVRLHTLSLRPQAKKSVAKVKKATKKVKTAKVIKARKPRKTFVKKVKNSLKKIKAGELPTIHPQTGIMYDAKRFSIEPVGRTSHYNVIAL